MKTFDGMGLFARKLRGRVVVVTGASSGIGRAIAHAFAAEGCKLALLARNEGALKHAAHEVEELGGEALVLPTDVADPAQVNAAATATLERFGAIDVWVNNAMVTTLSPAVEMSPEEFQRITSVNYLGAVYGTLAALRHMRPKNEGHVIQIGSALAYRSIPLQSAYCATKAAMRAFTESVRTELFHEKSEVALSMLQLPAVNTPQFDVGRNHMNRKMKPVGKIFEPEVIGRAAVWAAKRQPRELVIGGSALKAIVGEKVIPGVLDHYLGHAAWEGQLTSDAKPRSQPDNLFKPVPFDPGTHGRFDKGAKTGSFELWLRQHRVAVGTALSLLVGAFWVGRS